MLISCSVCRTPLSTTSFRLAS
ncbi:MAG: hypothetical protein EOP49_24450 [Sphingobacteriales bacterium]|nr:MAG: hypothetical protein EOP49_24450 [Sphingobacteriales bacterium]